MRKTVFALLLALPLMAACTTNTTVNPQPGSSQAPTPVSSAPTGTAPVVAVSGAPGASGIAVGEVKTDATVKYAGFVFTPNAVTIKAGQSVGFYNGSGNRMRITSIDGTIDSGSAELEAGKTYVQTFAKAGTYTYKHQTNTSATGTVTVQ